MIKKLKMIDITPTWSSLMPTMIEVLEHGTSDGKNAVRAELLRLAQEVDSANGGK